MNTMKVKTLHTTLGLLGLSTLLLCEPAVAQSSSTVQFKGMVNEVTCRIDTGDVDKTVNLPVISANALRVAGTTAGSTPFSIVVHCPVEALQARAYFENTDYTDPDTGNLKLQLKDGQPGADKVQLRLLRVDGTPIVVGNLLSMPFFPVEAGEAKLEYQAAYYAIGEASAGPVYATATYTIDML